MQPKKGPLLSDFRLKKVYFEEFYAKKVHFSRISCLKRSTFEEFYSKPKKGPLWSDFTIKKRSMLNQKKKSAFEEFYGKPNKGPLLSNFTIKKVHFCRISQ